MKKIFLILFVCTVTGTVIANDTIPILNTVFHGINTILNIARLTTVVVTPTPVTQLVVIQPTIYQPAYIVNGQPIYLVNGQYVIYQNSTYIPYIKHHLHRRMPYRQPYHRQLPQKRHHRH